MSDLLIPEPLAERIREIARRERRTPEEILQSWVEGYSPEQDARQPDLQAAERELNQKLYRIARRYWAKVGDTARLALTDTDLDAQFWLIDHEGIPRLKSEQGAVELPPDPLETLVGLIETDLTDLSSTVAQSVDDYLRKKYGRLD